jgi:hypothetical protein
VPKVTLDQDSLPNIAISAAETSGKWGCCFTRTHNCTNPSKKLINSSIRRKQKKVALYQDTPVIAKSLEYKTQLKYLSRYRVEHDENFALFFLEKPVEMLRIIQENDVSCVIVFLPWKVWKHFNL